MRLATDHRPEILRSAARLFAQKRFDEVRMDDLAERVGVAKGTLYRFYPTKEVLYSALCFGWMDELILQIKAIAEGPEPVPERMERMIAHSVTHFRKHQDFFQV